MLKLGASLSSHNTLYNYMYIIAGIESCRHEAIYFDVSLFLYVLSAIYERINLLKLICVWTSFIRRWQRTEFGGIDDLPRQIFFYCRATRSPNSVHILFSTENKIELGDGDNRCTDLWRVIFTRVLKVGAV